MSKVVIVGKLSNWQSSPLHVGISVNDPTIEGDWAALSGRRVRVTVKVVEADPVDRLAGCKCHRCGGALCVYNHTEHHTYVEYPYAVWCNHCGIVGSHAGTQAGAIDAYLDAQKQEPEPEPRCPHCGGQLVWDVSCPWSMRYPCVNVHCIKCGALGNSSGPGSRQAALDALKAWQPPEPKCPHCGGKVEVVRDRGGGVYFGDEQKDIISPHIAHCKCGAHGEGKTRQFALDALAEWLDVCPRCGSEMRIYQVGQSPLAMFGTECSNPLCQLRLPANQISRCAAALWWNKREGRHG